MNLRETSWIPGWTLRKPRNSIDSINSKSSKNDRNFLPWGGKKRKKRREGNGSKNRRGERSDQESTFPKAHDKKAPLASLWLPLQQAYSGRDETASAPGARFTNFSMEREWFYSRKLEYIPFVCTYFIVLSCLRYPQRALFNRVYIWGSKSYHSFFFILLFLPKIVRFILTRKSMSVKGIGDEKFMDYESITCYIFMSSQKYWDYFRDHFPDFVYVALCPIFKAFALTLLLWKICSAKNSTQSYFIHLFSQNLDVRELPCL